MRLHRLRAIEGLLLPLTVATTALGLAAPALGQALKLGSRLRAGPCAGPRRTESL